MIKFFKILDGVIHEVGDQNQDTHFISEADWIDLHEPTDEERQLLEQILRTDLPEQGEINEIEASARCFVDHAGVHVHSLFLTLSEGRYHTANVACILQKNRLITIRENELADFRLLRLRAKRGQIEAKSAQELLIRLMEQKIESHADLLEDLHRELEGISYLVLEDETSELEGAIGQLAKAEDMNGKIRLCLMDTQRDISFLLRHLSFQSLEQETLREVIRDIETLQSHTTFLFDKINFLMDSTQGFINIEQNKIIKIFSIAAVVFLPPTLIASIYGMNFEFMPELKWKLGYPWAIGLMIAAGFAPYLYFKRKGWLK